MAFASPVRLIKRSAEYLTVDEILDLPRGLRGIYVLYKYRPRLDMYDVVYIGMTTAAKGGGIRGRLKSHSQRKQGLWTHCSIFEVWDNIRDEEIIELEGLFRHFYRTDSAANSLNKQKSYKPLKQIRQPDLSQWK